MTTTFSALLVSATLFAGTAASAQTVLLKNATVIDGNGRKPLPHTDILIQADTIAAVGPHLSAPGATVTDLNGKTVMPALISVHTHVGTLRGTTTNAVNYTRENILRQLQQYAGYGVLHVLAMGTDRPMLFESGLRDSSANGLLPGARLHSAGYGFGVPNAAPPVDFGMDLVNRPATAADVAPAMDKVAQVHPDVVKLWVDDFGGRFKKMEPAVYKTVITEAHRHGLRAASHLYYAADAQQLADAGMDIIAHSIRDRDIDDQLLQTLKKKGIVYVPTLSLDEYAYIYTRQPEWLHDEFFKRSLEPGVYEMITSPEYRQQLQRNPGFDKNKAAFETALRNLYKIYKAGILVALGTDSGATPVRAQGFSEHLELELMVQAGLTPLEAISAGTRNAARVLKLPNTGTIAPGQVADLLVLADNPEKDIKNTRHIVTVYKAGKPVRP
ncbi:amidohydrolase family protein [Chitinophaga qingshengii]|uniref:Amidohydrolase family protein n=1 Tax=Chitinophaga qingshengii TaxID=1569794 RepID=A0ABR7TVJ0_9BACT|nr:amidohydrolase family protein [Chitinophaga qingshengii]MBC9934506.1 amidohydrolase family protein [Chitinophaga qingshengii]